MWVNGTVYGRLLEDLGSLRDIAAEERNRHAVLEEQAAQIMEKLREELGTERGRREILSQQTAVQKGFVEFLCSRVNQLEAERVLLLRHLTSIELPTPSMRPTQPEPPPVDHLSALSALSIFEDDPSHAPRGWHADGSVNYDEPQYVPKGLHTP